MAEFCLECWSKINESKDIPKKYIFSKDLELCEGCGEWKTVIVVERKFYYRYKLRYVTLPFRIICKTIYFLFKLLMLPYLSYRYNKREDD